MPKHTEFKLKDPRVSLHAVYDHLNKENKIILEVYDYKSCVQFLEIEIQADNLIKLISGLAYVPCKAIARGLDKLNKQMFYETLKIEIPEGYSSKKNRKKLISLIDKKCPKGWTSDHYFGSQNSFVTDYELNKHYVIVTIRKWKEIKESKPKKEAK